MIDFRLANGAQHRALPVHPHQLPALRTADAVHPAHRCWTWRIPGFPAEPVNPCAMSTGTSLNSARRHVEFVHLEPCLDVSGLSGAAKRPAPSVRHQAHGRRPMKARPGRHRSCPACRDSRGEVPVGRELGPGVMRPMLNLRHALHGTAACRNAHDALKANRRERDRAVRVPGCAPRVRVGNHHGVPPATSIRFSLPPQKA